MSYVDNLESISTGLIEYIPQYQIVVGRVAQSV